VTSLGENAALDSSAYREFNHIMALDSLLTVGEHKQFGADLVCVSSKAFGPFAW
jgi:hypothetical protein